MHDDDDDQASLDAQKAVNDWAILSTIIVLVGAAVAPDWAQHILIGGGGATAAAWVVGSVIALSL